MSALLSTGEMPPLRAALTPGEIRTAREVSVRERRSVPEVIEDQLELAPAALIELLGRSLSYQTLSMAELELLSPAFDLLPVSGSSQPVVPRVKRW